MHGEPSGAYVAQDGQCSANGHIGIVVTGKKLRSERLATELDGPYSLLGLGVCGVVIVQVDLFPGGINRERIGGVEVSVGQGSIPGRRFFDGRKVSPAEDGIEPVVFGLAALIVLVKKGKVRLLSRFMFSRVKCCLVDGSSSTLMVRPSALNMSWLLAPDVEAWALEARAAVAFFGGISIAQK